MPWVKGIAKFQPHNFGDHMTRILCPWFGCRDHLFRKISFQSFHLLASVKVAVLTGRSAHFLDELLIATGLISRSLLRKELLPYLLDSVIPECFYPSISLGTVRFSNPRESR